MPASSTCLAPLSRGEIPETDERGYMAQTIRELMTENPRTVSPDQTIQDAAKIMRDEDTGVVPITEGDSLAGVITDRDIAIRAVAEGRDGAQTTVREIASQDVVTIDPQQDLDEALRLMAQHQLRRLPGRRGAPRRRRPDGRGRRADLGVTGGERTAGAPARGSGLVVASYATRPGPGSPSYRTRRPSRSSSSGIVLGSPVSASSRYTRASNTPAGSTPRTKYNRPSWLTRSSRFIVPQFGSWCRSPIFADRAAGSQGQAESRPGERDSAAKNRGSPAAV